MYINGLNCSWLDHPFATNTFKINSETDIRKVIAAGIKEVEIDTKKGLDIYIEETAEPSVEKRKPGTSKS